jgi:hypothetical protein
MAPSPCFLPLSHWPSYVSPLEYLIVFGGGVLFDSLLNLEQDVRRGQVYKYIVVCVCCVCVCVCVGHGVHHDVCVCV